jgi:phospholipase C
VGPKETLKLFWPVSGSGNWYDFSVSSENGFHRQFAGRLEDGKDHITDPQMGRPIAPYTSPALG